MEGAVFARWHEPDDARVSRSDLSRLGVEFPGPTRQALSWDFRGHGRNVCTRHCKSK